jgi:hypothetical protein
MARSYKQGVFTPRHPEKYVGNANNIVFRSSWELSMNQFLDNNPNILRWSSEEIAIPYVKPTTGRVHRYFPDYWIEYKDRDGNLLQEILEVKPSTEVNPNLKKRKSNYDKLTYAINLAKWKAASQFCEKRNMKFRILTENQLFSR